MNAVYGQEPVDYLVEPALEGRNRLTTFFRFILAIPHLFFASALSYVVAPLAVFSWFTLVFAGRMPRGTVWVQQQALSYMAKEWTYTYLLRDEYPPFWEGAYPISVELREDEGVRNRVSVAFRLLLVIPLFLWLVILAIALVFVLFFAWVAIVFSARLPQSFHSFIEGYLRLSLRTYWFLILGTDRFPSFSLRP